MLDKIIAFSIKNKLIIGLLVMGIIGYGLYELKKLPIDAVPDITNNQVQVITVAPALGAPDVERLITFPIEQLNNNIPGLQEIRSFSRFGLSVITIVFHDEVDIYWARQQVAERLQEAKALIPKGIGTPSLAPVTTGLGEIYQYILRPKKGYEHQYNAMDLRTIQDWVVRRQLLGVEGVAEVSSFGGLQKQYEIAVVPERLLAHHITMEEVFEALEKNNQNTGGAYIEKEATALFIRSEGLVGSIQDIQQIVIKNTAAGIPLLIKDVADVRWGHATRYGAMTYNGEQQVSGAVVLMLKGANSNAVINNIKARVAQIQKTLPEGVVLEAFLDRSKMVNNAIRTVTTNLLEGALIVVFVLVLFLGNFRAGLLVASVIPLSMLFAIIMMNVFGVSGNLMSLGALDFGLIVDGAVIIVEAVMHKLGHRVRMNPRATLSTEEMDGEVKQSATKMMRSAAFGQAIILIVYLPILTLEGIEGKMFKPMAQTVAFALIGAFLLSLTYIPMMSALLLNKTLSEKPSFSDRMMQRIEPIYQQYLLKALAHKKAVLGTVVLLFAIALYVLTTLGGEFIPSLPEGDFAVETRVLPGSNLNTSIEAVSKASKVLLEKFPEVEKVVGRTGASEVPTDPMPLESSDLMIILKDRSEWTSAKTYPELEEKMSQALSVIPGVMYGFQYPVAMRFNELISGARQDVVCKVYGEDLDTLAHYAKKLGALCHQIEGSSGVYVETVTGIPQIVIRYHRAALAQYGLSISSINRVVNTAFAGENSGTVYEGEKRFDLVVRLSGDRRQDIADVQNLLIPTSSGTQIPLSTVASVTIADGPYQIQRENSQRRIIVGLNVRGRDVQSLVQELQQKVATQIKLPTGYYITYGGAFENLQAATQRLYIAVPISLLLIFILLYFAFHSVKQGLLIYTAIPLSAMGGIFALAIRGTPFSISAGVGFIALFGVAVLNGIVLIAAFNQLKQEGNMALQDIVIEGTKSRLRPVLMTAFVASLGFLPMALSHGEGAEVQRPLATVVIGGLLIATFLTLFVLPILYLVFNKDHSSKMKPKHISPLFVLLLLAMQGTAFGQRSITLQQAIDTAINNNLNYKNEQLRNQYHRQRIQTAIAIPNTNVYGEYGQINSIYLDKKIGLSQSIPFPTVYTRQRQLLKEEWKSRNWQTEMSEISLRKQVATVYFQWVYLLQKKSLLWQNDSLFAAFQQKANLRFQKGESNVLEKTTAEAQRGQIALQLSQLEQDLAIVQLQFQALLNTTISYTPSEQQATLIHNDSLADLSLHPILQYYQQQQKVAQAATQAAKAAWLPEFTIGYALMGMKGTGADNVTHNDALKFQSMQIGIGFPFFSGAQRAQLRATKTNEVIATNEAAAQSQLFATTYRSAWMQYQKCRQAVLYFEQTALQNATTIIQTANLQFVNGAINYLEWVLLMHQAIDIQSIYIEAMHQQNEAILELNTYHN